MAYTLVIGTRNWSSWSLRPWLALRATGAPFAEIVIALRRGEETRADILRHSPAGRVPVLKIAEGGHETVVWDSLAICETLAERYPHAHLWPADPDARAHARSLAAEMHAGFPALREALSMDFARTRPTPDLGEAAKEQIARVIAAWNEALSRHGGDFLCGGFSIADCFYAPVVSRFLTYGIDLPPPARAYAARVMALAPMQDWRAAAKAEVEAGAA